MSILFDQPAGFWALAAVPAIVAIHFLRPAARRARTSTLFLLEHLDPGTSRARRLRRLKTTTAFWLQLLAAVLLTWLLVEPRWLREGSRQNVALVLDCTASMRAFRPEAIAAVEREMARWSAAASQTTWLVRETDPRRAPLYQGTSAAAARAALARWKPDAGAHEFDTVLRDLRYALGESATLLLITDHRVAVPPAVGVIGVGRLLANSGFAGATVDTTEAGTVWRALVQLRGRAVGTPTLRVLDRAGRELAPARGLALNDGAILTVEGTFPAGVDELTLALEDDGFDLDDRVPLVRPRPRALKWALAADAPPLLKKFVASLENASNDNTTPDLRLLTASAGALPAISRGAAVVTLRPAEKADGLRAESAPVFAEKHPLVSGLVWDGLLATGPGGLRPATDATVLLWQAGRELAWLENRTEGVRLVLNLDLAHSNAERLPAFVVLLERFVAAARADLRTVSAENVETHQRLDVGSGWRQPGDALALDPGGPVTGPLVTPGEPGFFVVRCGAGEVLRGAARFGDGREGDFRGAETFELEGRSVADAARVASQPDPWRPLWLLAVLGCLGGAWFAARKPENAEHRTAHG